MVSRKFPLGILLLSGFIDYMGIAIVYPLLSHLLFDTSFHFLPLEATSATRGLWLGVLMALTPLFQFIFAPIFGPLSDLRGRKKLLLLTFWIGLVGYALAVAGIYFESLTLFALYRIFVGIGCGNSSIVSAIVADISAPEKKAQNYGLLNMAFGAGFTLGPFVSGMLAQKLGYAAPFLAGFTLVTINLAIVWWKLDETRPKILPGRVKLLNAFHQLKQAALMSELRFIFLALLLFSFGWSFFTEFIPLFLLDRFGFNPIQIGLFYGYAGFFFSVSSGFLVYPILKKVGIVRGLSLSMLFGGLYLIAFLGIGPHLLWLYVPLSQFFLAFAFPATSALISNCVSDERQGEVMGVYQSIIAFALTITPFLSGSIVGDYPHLTVVVSGIFMVVAAFPLVYHARTFFNQAE